jgi:hypothetical protein
MYDENESLEPELPAELAALERQLTQLTPAAPRVDRDQLMFAAGRTSRSAERSWTGSWFWPAATALSTAATILLATLLVWQRNGLPSDAMRPTVTTNNVAAPEDANDFRSLVADRPAWPWSDRWSDRMPSGYLGVRYVALTQGVAALDRGIPTAVGDASEPSPPATAQQLLEELLPKPTHTSS